MSKYSLKLLIMSIVLVYSNTKTIDLDKEKINFSETCHYLKEKDTMVGFICKVVIDTHQECVFIKKSEYLMTQSNVQLKNIIAEINGKDNYQISIPCRIFDKL